MECQEGVNRLNPANFSLESGSARKQPLFKGRVHALGPRNTQPTEFELDMVQGSFKRRGPSIPFKLLHFPETAEELAEADDASLSDFSFLDESASEAMSSLCISTNDSLVKQRGYLGRETADAEQKAEQKAFPSRMYCSVCQKQVGTVVRHLAPEVSFWNKICCSKAAEDSGYTVTHSCRYCMLQLAKFVNVH